MSLLGRYMSRAYCSKSVFQPMTFKHTKDHNDFLRQANTAEKYKGRKWRESSHQDQPTQVITSVSRSEEETKGNRQKIYVSDRKNWLDNTNKYQKDSYFSKNSNHQDHFKSRKPKSFSRQNYEDVLNDDGKELIFGIFPIYLALLAQQRTFFEIICKKGLEISNENVKKILQLAEERGVRVRLVPLNAIRNIVPGGVVHQNICSVVSPFPVDAFLHPEEEGESVGLDKPLKDVEGESFKEASLVQDSDSTETEVSPVAARFPTELSVLLDDVVDPMNMGAIMRSCCYFGVNRVFITHSCSPINALVSKASAGAVELLKVSMMPQPELSLEYLKSIGFRILATSSEQENSVALNLQDFKPTTKTLLILGNESRGISSALASTANITLKVPPVGANAQLLASLNVSTAAAVVLHAISSTAQNVE